MEPEAAGPLFRTIPEIVEKARARMPVELWANSFGGAESETTILDENPRRLYGLD